MTGFKSITVLLLVFMLLRGITQATACSMYKITANGTTMVGCNHDTWFLTPRVWFETNGYGAGFTGARFDGANGFAPQSGMNEFGLAFSRLAAAPPDNAAAPSNKKKITNPTLYLKDILHTCKTVEEVHNYIAQYDHSFFIQDVFIYVDKSGKYLLVEPSTMATGNDPNYVLANFCPSQITDFSSIKQERYANGTAFLKHRPAATNVQFCTALSDTMHVCREKVGDGTLMTSIWDTRESAMYLYFYHDYAHPVKFDLKAELAKGNHLLDVTTLFPKNKEFQQLADYKTPLNSAGVRLFLLFCFGLFSFSFLYFLASYFIRKQLKSYANLRLALAAFSLPLAYYMFALSTEMSIFYFPAPYRYYRFSLLDIAAYIPFLLLLLIVPAVLLNKRIIRQNTWKLFPKILFTLNNATYLALIGFFAYWRLYGV